MVSDLHIIEHGKISLMQNGLARNQVSNCSLSRPQISALTTQPKGSAQPDMQTCSYLYSYDTEIDRVGGEGRDGDKDATSSPDLRAVIWHVYFYPKTNNKTHLYQINIHKLTPPLLHMCQYIYLWQIIQTLNEMKWCLCVGHISPASTIWLWRNVFTLITFFQAATEQIIHLYILTWWSYKHILSGPKLFRHNNHPVHN